MSLELSLINKYILLFILSEFSPETISDNSIENAFPDIQDFPVPVSSNTESFFFTKNVPEDC